MFYSQAMAGSPLPNLKRCTHSALHCRPRAPLCIQTRGPRGSAVSHGILGYYCDLVAAPLQLHDLLSSPSKPETSSTSLQWVRHGCDGCLIPTNKSLTARGAQFTLLHPTSCVRVTPRSTLWMIMDRIGLLGYRVMRHGLRLVSGTSNFG